MNHKLIKIAIAYPHSYPWVREKEFEFKDGELDNLLETYNLDTELKRRNAGWRIKFYIIKEAIESNSNEELINKVTEKLKNEKYCSVAIIKWYSRRLGLDNSLNLELFKRFLNNEITADEFESNMQQITVWLIDVLAYYNCCNFELGSRELQDKVKNYINELLNNTNDYHELTKNGFFKAGLIKNHVVKQFSIEIREYTGEINQTLRNFITKKTNEQKVDKVSTVNETNETNVATDCDSEVEDNITDSILSLFNNSTKLVLNEEEANEINNSIEIEEEVNELNSSENIKHEIKEEKSEVVIENEFKYNKILNDLKSLSSNFGYQVASKDEIVLSKEKYNKLVEADKEKEIQLLKELALLKNGAILSELYNAYKNINDISKENLEAILTNFFVTLKVNEFEAIEERNNIGDIVEVDTNNVLKEFVFTEATNVKGKVNVKIEHLGWRYKDRQVVPMSVKVVENKGDK